MSDPRLPTALPPHPACPLSITPEDPLGGIVLPDPATLELAGLEILVFRRGSSLPGECPGSSRQEEVPLSHQEVELLLYKEAGGTHMELGDPLGSLWVISGCL